jgi:hypothetical protein
MIWDILKSRKFGTFFSFMLGIGLVCLFRPICQGNECNIAKPPPINDFNGSVYKMGRDCYEFTTEISECPQSGSIEAFRDEFNRRGSPIRQCE